MGGRIGVDSEFGRGSRFHFTVRCQRIEDRLAQPRPRRHIERPLKVLLTDTNMVSAQVMTEYLTRWGLDVTVVHGLDEAAKADSRENFDAVLLDVKGLGAPAVEFGRNLASGAEAAPAVIFLIGMDKFMADASLTAHALADIHQATIEAGMDDFLTKPFDERQINDALRRWIPQCETKAAPEPAAVRTATPIAREPKGGESGAIDRGAFDKIAAFRGPNGAALMKKVVGKFQDAAPALTGTVVGSAGEGDIEALWRAAHSLKSSAAAVGAARLSQRCAEIETLGRAGDMDGLKPLLDGLERDLSDALAGLTELIEEADVRVA